MLNNIYTMFEGIIEMALIWCGDHPILCFTVLSILGLLVTCGLFDGKEDY